MKLSVLITTYNRCDSLLLLLQDIVKYRCDHDIHLYIFDDCSTDSYNKVNEYIRKNFTNVFYFRNQSNGGKAKYWQAIDFMFNKIKSTTFDYVFQLPDDVRLTNDFFKIAIKTYEGIHDTKKICLNLLNDYSRYSKSMWTSFQSVKTGNVWRTGWIDLCYIAPRRFFEFLNWSIIPESQQWLLNKNRSTGVGKYISEQIVRKGLYFYQVDRSLLIHDHHSSKLHPDHREEVPLISNHSTEKIIAGMATFAGREKNLLEAVSSIIGQVDELNVYCNNMSRIPGFLRNKKINVFESRKEAGDIGDIGKFYAVERANGYFFSLDDDIIYPHDYVNTSIYNIERYRRKHVITYHGRIFNNLPVTTYYRGASFSIACLNEQIKDTQLHVGGTGVMCYNTQTLKVKLESFKLTNMSDVWMAKICHEKNIPITSCRHSRNWLKNASPSIEKTIYGNLSRNDENQTQIINKLKFLPIKITA